MITDQQKQSLQSYLRSKYAEWHQSLWLVTQPWDVETLANEMASDVRFADLQLCGLWYGPNETELRNIIEPMLQLAEYGPEVTVVVAAMALACHKRRVQSNPVVALVDLVASAASKVGSGK
jgi:hypothetical protein